MTETSLTPEDDKLATLAKGARARVQATSGAAARDTTGRTYASANVDRENLRLSAVELAIGQAVASGATGIEAVVVATDAAAIEVKDLSIVRSIGGSGIAVHQVDSAGNFVSSQLT